MSSTCLGKTLAFGSFHESGICLIFVGIGCRVGWWSARTICDGKRATDEIRGKDTERVHVRERSKWAIYGGNDEKKGVKTVVNPINAHRRGGWQKNVYIDRKHSAVRSFPSPYSRTGGKVGPIRTAYSPFDLRPRLTIGYFKTPLRRYYVISSILRIT